jgi:hypothetical protein
MDFNKLFGRIRDIDQGKKAVVTESSLKECGMPMGMESNMPPVTPPVSMSVNLNAQGIDQIKDLLSLMNKADSPLAAGPVSTDSMPPMPMPTVGMDAPLNISKAVAMPPEPETAPMGMDPLDDLVKKAGITMAPKADDGKEGGESPAEKPAPKDAVSKMADDIRTMTDTLANTPQEEIAGIDAVTATGDDLHSKGGEAPKVNGGGNPMKKESQIKSDLMKLYMEMKEGKKSKPDFLDMDKDGDKKEPMKKAVKDKAVDEGFDADAKTGDTFKTAKGTATKTSTGVKHTRDKYEYDPGSDDKDDKKMKRDAKKK